MKIVSNDGTKANIKVTEAEVQRMIYTYERLIKTLCEENKQLKANRDEVIELINEDRNKNYGSLEKKSFYCSKTNKLLEILERGKE